MMMKIFALSLALLPTLMTTTGDAAMADTTQPATQPVASGAIEPGAIEPGAIEPGATKPGAIEPGAVWTDTDGNPINCHGGGFLFVGGTCYWHGEFKAQRHGKIGVSCYSSEDMYHWKSRGLMLTTSETGADSGGDLTDGCVIERPKVIYNPKTKKFVMWFHLELSGQGYASARAGVAISDSPTGPFKYVGSSRLNAGCWPLNFPKDLQEPLSGNARPDDPDDFVRRDFTGGQMSRDMTLYVDDDGSAYQITASEENATIHISKLSDDFLKTTGQYVRALVGECNEAPAVFKHHGKYYMITSGTTGWRPNAARLAVADSLLGEWKPLGNPCVGTEEQVERTFRSQATAVIPVPGKKDAFIYVGDRWQPRDLPHSPYIWLPISFKDDKPILTWKDRWDLSVFDSVH